MTKDSQNRFVSPKAWERIEQWSRRKPVFALMGEFSAGKSTLMNFLLRTQALPTQVTATQLPPIWFSWGNKPAFVKRHDGSTESITLDQLESVGVNDAQFIRIYLEADILEAVDLIDTPGISDPKISTDVWRRAIGQANGVLWCTHATQAWRETERATWVSLPERLQNNSLLLVTRVDALDVKDRQKVLRRVNREAGHLFNRSILFSARDAITARDKTGDAELWSRSGGGKMVDSFLEITEHIMDNRAEQLSRYQIDKTLSNEPRVQPLRPPRKTDCEADKRPESEAAPLQLVNPLADESDEPKVVTSFPVRPARVERQGEDSERPRIDAAEAERLRAEMVPDTVDSSKDGEDDDDLRTFFRKTSEGPLDLTALARSTSDEDEFDLLDEDELDEEARDPAIATSKPEDWEESETLIATAEDNQADAPEDSVEEEAEKEEGIEVSVSSITALLAQQSDKSDQEYEPEPEDLSPAEAEILSMPGGNTEAPSRESENIDAIAGQMSAPKESSLSASAMWREIAKDEDLPEDAEGLKNVFTAFLAEFDKIAVEHNEQQTKEALRPMAKTSENSRAEWHVL